MSDSVQEEIINQEEDFRGNSTKIYYIVSMVTGRAQGKIELHQTEDLEILPARIPEPDHITAQQVDALISPRNITLVTTAKKSLTGRHESPPHERFLGQRIIRGIHCSVFGITIKEFGEIIFAKQEGRIVCAKFINFYYKGGKEKGKYCQLTYFLQVDPSNTIPNWKFYCLGNEYGNKLPSGSHSSYSEIHKINTVLYRISKVEIPPVGTYTQLVESIKNSTTIE
jgi:hypothetical protein